MKKTGPLEELRSVGPKLTSLEKEKSTTWKRICGQTRIKFQASISLRI